MSEKYKLPDVSTAIPHGEVIVAAVAGPPSPSVPVP